MLFAFSITDRYKRNMKKEEINTNEEEKNKIADNNLSNEEQTTEEREKETVEKDPLDVALAEVEDLKGQLLYKAAEFENFRKRTVAEKAELILNGGQNVIEAILPVLDDMERAIANAAKTDNIKALEEGWELIAKKLNKTLEGLGVQKIETNDAEFDTDYHEAVAMVPGVEDDKKGKVIDCVQTGYMMNDKVIRHAKVAVGQ
jgi:molecular chaperone GrpE